MNKQGLHVAFLIVFIGSCVTSKAQQNAPSPVDPRDVGLPQVIVVSQPESPLLLTTSARWATPGREILDLYVMVKNRDTKSIRAYTTRIDFDGRKLSEACPVENVYFPDKVIKQDDGDGKSRFTATKDTPAIQVSVDYVEFVDGSTWGPDTCQTVEYLAGERAGGDAAIKWFKNLVAERGAEVVIEVIRNRNVSVVKPSSSSARWDEGFRFGVEIISHRVLEAYNKDGEAAITVALSKPYDASTIKQ